MTYPFFVLHRWGKSEKSDNPSTLQALLAELDAAVSDDEHVSVAVRVSDGWSLSAYVSGLIIFENVEELKLEPRHIRVQTRDEARTLMTLLISGDMAGLEKHSWRPGNG